MMQHESTAMVSVAQSRAVERLKTSRLALVRCMARAQAGYGPGDEQFEDSTEQNFGAPALGAWPLLKRAFRFWWSRHPTHLLLDLSSPALGKLATEKPLQLLGVSAGVGAAVSVIGKPN